MPGPGNFVPEHRRDQPSLQEALGNDFVEQIGIRVGRVEVRRIDVAGNDGEEFDVLLSHDSGQTGTVADRDLVERPVFNHSSRKQPV